MTCCWIVPQEHENWLNSRRSCKKGKVPSTVLSEKMESIASPNAAIRAVSNDEACECEADKRPYKNTFLDVVIFRCDI